MEHLGEIVRLFGRLGWTAFGGPAAHIAMMREEVVHRRQWLGDEQFVDLIGIANLIPGPYQLSWRSTLAICAQAGPGSSSRGSVSSRRPC